VFEIVPSPSIDRHAAQSTHEKQQRHRFRYFLERHARDCRAERVICMIEEKTSEDTNRSSHKDYIHGSLALQQNNLAE